VERALACVVHWYWAEILVERPLAYVVLHRYWADLRRDALPMLSTGRETCHSYSENEVGV